jgi:hypothetical protein
MFDLVLHTNWRTNARHILQCTLRRCLADVDCSPPGSICATVATCPVQEVPHSTRLPPSRASGCAARDGHDVAVTALLQLRKGMLLLLSITDLMRALSDQTVAIAG